MFSSRRTGRPSKLAAQTKRYLLREVEQVLLTLLNWLVDIVELSSDLPQSGAYRTIMICMADDEERNHHFKENIKTRLALANDCLNKTMTYWEEILSDWWN